MIKTFSMRIKACSSLAGRFLHVDDYPTMKDFLVKIFIPAAVVVFSVNFFFGGDYKNSKLISAQKAFENGSYKYAFYLYSELLDEDSLNPLYHRELLKTQFMIKNSGKIYHTDNFVRGQYVLMSKENDPGTSDMGFYGLGIYYTLRGEYITALRNFSTIKNRNVPYVNNSAGIAFLGINKPDIAESHFRREIELGGFVEGAARNLSYLYQQQGELDKIYELSKDPKAGRFVPSKLTSEAMVSQSRFFSYFIESLKSKGITLSGFIAAVIVLIIWTAFLQRLHSNGKANTVWLLSALLLGMFFAEFCSIYYDIIYHGLDLKIGQSPIRDLIYCIFGVGLIEESMKLLPFLIILKISGQINKPIDYIIYASISALGFAFMENLNYFKSPGLSIVSVRTLSAVVLHMSLTSFAVYGLVYAKYIKNNKHKIAWLGGTWAAAVVIHGLYDFWLSAEWINDVFKLTSIIILIMAAREFGLIINKSLYMGRQFQDNPTKITSSTRYLVYSLSAVFLSQHFITGWQLGAYQANLGSVRSFIVFYILAIIIVKSLGSSGVLQDCGRRELKTVQQSSPSAQCSRA
ncbi:Protease PrsW [Limihaloglobus sulfuriphilus]|uniref:Protease PrsW n=1 Tax=Limihaloglobus sulfuriphilus TaxID=1851148 RepID=A0A1Q2MDD6_9BACT|nr:PrsW family intramembrane metalloprotease [Limihaloglobus sulfuriphilus]AQQ70664.1 Protease PrsW [Limihaloglobus sulfuriphilus]